ncbi:ATP-binding protein [Aquabacterium sp. A7-Y]|uniref:response regulator n=1 Tax=Aquabacterium sp. A7-Y TaxID=1349605 RepID=UPI00223DFEF3|nr:response regulator [Aquabacterium sp. A7-Y]MCW7536579.1 ATP-binding protein [Aquabacterium sp. A7-Y]
MQRRMFWLSAWLTAAGTGAFAVFFFLRGPLGLAWMELVMLALVAAVALHVARTGRADRGIAVLACALAVMLGSMMWLQGGLAAPTTWWLMVLPWLWMLAGSVRGGALLGVAVATVFLAAWAAQATGRLPPPLLSRSPHLQDLLSMAGALLLYGIFVVFSLRLRSDLQRELKLAMAELQRSRDEAWSASQVKASFLSNVSHELRTPINGILGATELLRATPLDTRQQQMVAMQRQSLDSLMALVNDVLDYTRLDGGSLRLEHVPLSLRAVVFDALDLWAGAAHEKGLELTCSQDADVPAALLGDPTRLRQILSHLVSNGVKFTHQGGVHVHIAVAAAPPEDRLPGRVPLRIEVRDSGIGIEPIELPRLFDAFAQADPSGSRRAGGTGLGLALSRELAELMGGQIEAQSEPGQGSCFTLSVSLQPSSEQAEPALPELPEQQVLLVVDQHRLALHVDALLRGSAVRVELKAMPPSRLELLAARERGIGAVLLDERLLGARGRERLEQMVGEGGLPVLLLRSVSRDSSQIDLDGVFALAKPVRPRALYEALQWAAQARRGAGPAPVGGGSPASAALTGRVLLVEDNPVNQVMTQAMLERLGLQVVIAGSGQEGLQRYAEQGFDVVLMDVQMPGMDGLTATRRLREFERDQGRPRTPVLAVTGNPEPEVRDRGRAAGMDDFLGKPFTLEQLEQMLSRWQPGARHVAAAPDRQAGGVSPA